jgi:hypothetical protein
MPSLLGVYITKYLTIYPPDLMRINVKFCYYIRMVFKQARGTRRKAQGKHPINVNVP